jgi:predicted nucleotidyltransferase
VEQAILYGSRAKGNFKSGSDIDLTLHGNSISFKELSEIYAELGDLLLPYTIDLRELSPCLLGQTDGVMKFNRAMVLMV